MLPVKKILNVSDPLNLTLDEDGEPIGPLSPTGEPISDSGLRD